MKKDIVIAGGSLGGVRAAISACKHGKSVYMCESTDWIGGQLTSQAVPPDEHKWIEQFGATKSYLEYRKKVRDHYRNLDNISEKIKNKEIFCPGNSWVSRISHEPKVALKILTESLQPYIDNGLLTIEYFTEVIDAIVENDIIKSITVKNCKTQQTKIIQAEYFLDATDCGDLLPIVKAEYTCGAEGKNQTNEFHALKIADNEDMQPITWVAALEYNEDNKVKIKKPEMYHLFEHYKMPYDDVELFSFFGPDAKTKKKTPLRFYDNELEDHTLGLWSYRRIIASNNYTNNPKEVSLINVPQNDFVLGNIYECSDTEKNMYLAKQQTLSFIYWLQNEAPNPKTGKRGYPVNLRPDILGTEDGLAKAPYIRESRRIVAKKIITENDISKRFNNSPPVFEDSVGVGHYAIDIHLTTKSHSFFYDDTYPFEIPLSAMIPIRIKNLIPACKNIGCTHLTNGCYRLHPVEWNIGEVAGLLAAYCLDKNVTPSIVDTNYVKDFQDFIVENGIQIHWDFSKMNI